MSPSHVRPATIAVPPRQHSPPCHGRRPTLKEILSNTSEPPWNLTAFMAYLSGNHCLETLEFTMDAARYKKHYAKVLAKLGDDTLSPTSKEAENINALWRRLIEAYIRPNGTREVNIPSGVRDPILTCDTTKGPPPPETLDAAVAKVYELMEESVLGPFLNSVAPAESASAPASAAFLDDTALSPRDDKSLFRKSRFGRASTGSGSSTSKQKFSSTATLPSSLPSSSNRNPIPSYRAGPTSLPSSTINGPSSSSSAHVRQSPSNSVSARAPLLANAAPGDSASAYGLTDDSGYTSSHTNDSGGTPPPSSPSDADLALSPRQSRDSGAWKKFGRLGQWKVSRKKSSNNFKDTESMP